MQRLLALTWLAGAATAATPVVGEHAAGAATIRVEAITADVRELVRPLYEGRDGPSAGAALAARWLAGRFAALDLRPAADARAVFDAERGHRPWLPPSADDGGTTAPEEAGEGRTKSAPPLFLRPFSRPLVAPLPERCALTLLGSDGERNFAYGAEFVPIAGADGEAEAELVFAGFGIDAPGEKYDDFKGVEVERRVVLILEGEPRHKRRFGGERETLDVASLWPKLERLREEGAAAVIVVRRTPPALAELDDEDLAAEAPPLAYRYGYATFEGERMEIPPRKLPPALVVSEAVATQLLGVDVRELAQEADASAKPQRWKADGRRVRLRAATELVDVVSDNVVGIVPGSDPALAQEYVVVGAHYDHIGAGPRGRVGHGADDNGSGTAALLAVAQAMSTAGPRRSVVFIGFCEEEDGLLGSRAFCRKLPFPGESIVAMLNLDMIGRGADNEVVVLGLVQNPAFEDTLERALRLSRTGIREFRDCRDPGLFQRSDHHSFHQLLGVPVLFFFENYPVERNPDYHTPRDTIDTVDMDKVTNTARLAFNVAWLWANDDERPPEPARR